MKLCDFGLVRTAFAGAGTPSYMAPELFVGKPFSKKVDVYAFGVLAGEVFSEEVPFLGYDYADLKRRVPAGHRPDPRPPARKTTEAGSRRRRYVDIPRSRPRAPPRLPRGYSAEGGGRGAAAAAARVFRGRRPRRVGRTRKKLHRSWRFPAGPSSTRRARSSTSSRTASRARRTTAPTFRASSRRWTAAATRRRRSRTATRSTRSTRSGAAATASTRSWGTNRRGL